MRGWALLATVLGAALLLASFAASASAARLVGRDGKVYACYKAKGKAKGAVRLVRRHQRCRRGERKVHWSVKGPAGPQGPSGSAGSNGSVGATGAAGQSALESKVTELTTRIESLEGTLNGVTNETLKNTVATVDGVTNTELTGALTKLSGVTGPQLQETVSSLADVNALCTRTSALTTQVNGVGNSLENTALGGVIPLGLELLVPGLPSELSPFSCP